MLRQLKDRARGVRTRLDGPELRAARRLVRRLHTDPPDVLYFGDSTNFAFHADGDTRQIGRMLQDLLGASVSVHPIAGGGYHPAVVEAFLQIVAQSESRPVVATSTSVRMQYDAWLKHPSYTYAREIDALRAVNVRDPLYRIRCGLAKPTPADFQSYEALIHPTMLGDLAIRDYQVVLKDPDRIGTPEWLRWMYAYHHTARTGADGLGQLASLGATLAALGCPVVAYVAPICVDRGVELLGQSFREIVTDNLATVAGTFAGAAGEKAVILHNGTSFAPEEYVDPDDATEHLNGQGRLRLSTMVAEQVERLLPSP